MRKFFVLLVLFVASLSFGQTLVYTRVVKGNLWLPPGTPATNSKMRFQLKYCGGQSGRVPVNPGNPPGPTGLIVSFEPFDVNVASDGTWQTQVYGNDQIICGTDMSGPSRWLIQPIFNGQAGAGVEYKIQSCGAASPCTPFSPDTAPQCSLTVVTDCAVETGNPDQPDTTVTVNAVMAIPNAYNFGNVLLPPANGTVINFLQNGNQAGAYLPGNGNASTCLSGTGTWVLCGGGGGGGVTGATPNRGLVLSGTTLGLITCSTNQYLSWNGSAWVCTTLSGGGAGGLPTTTQYDLFGSTGAGAAQASGILGGNGFLKGQVMLATGDVTSAPAPFPLAPNASMEYFPTGASFSGVNAGGPNGLAAFFSHSGVSGTSGNGGLMLGGGNSSGTNYQVYVDCESSPTLGCDFKVPITVNGAAVGGGGGGATLPTIAQWNLFASNGSGGAQDSTIKAGPPGFLQTEVLTATGDMTSAPAPFQLFPNAGVEYFPTGYAWSGGTAGATNGLAMYMSHSAGSSAANNGGVALGGGNSSSTGNQVYLDCETSGCDFKVPVSYLGGGLGGGGGGSGTVASGTLGHFAWYAATGTTVNSNANLDDGQTTAGTITSQEPIAAPQVNVNGAVGTGISMTGVGGTLPSVATGSGGVGIGPGGIPSYNPNGTGWVAIGSGGGGGVTLPACSTTPANACVLASNAAGTAAVDTGVQATNGFIYSGASIVHGTSASSPFTGANASQEFYGAGGTITPSTGSPITFTNGAALFMGHGALTTGATGDAGIALGGGSATPTERIYLDCEVAGCDFKVPVTQNGVALGGGAGSGTVNPNPTVVGSLAYYPAAANSTAVGPVPYGTASSSGINLGAAILQFGSSTTVNDIGIARLGPNIIGLNNGNNSAVETGLMRSGNSCAQTTAISFTSTGLASTFCQRSSPSGTSRAWILHCVIPWSFTTASGSSTVQIGITTGTTLPSASYFTTVLWNGTPTPVGQTAIQLPVAAGTTWLMTTGSLTVDTTTIYTAFIDGVLSSSSSSTTTVSVALQTGTAGIAGQIQPGAYCRFE